MHFQHHLETKYSHHDNVHWTTNFLLIKMWVKCVTSFKSLLVQQQIAANCTIECWLIFFPYYYLQNKYKVVCGWLEKKFHHSFSEWLLFWCIFFNEPNLCEGCSVKRKVHKNITHDWSHDCASIQRQHTTAVKYTFYGLLSVLQ